MPPHQLTGARIRARRLDRGLRQSDLAKAVGISPSYLNLIEHNRRKIAGKLLNDLARALTIDPGALAEGPNTELIDVLRRAVADGPEPDTELLDAGEFAGTFPGWAGLVANQARRIAQLETTVTGLTDRLTHDPHLATSLHQMISAVTSIRSASSILISDGSLDRDWQDRFHRNIYDDSVRLAESSRDLVDYFEGPEEVGARGLSPQEEVARFLEEKSPDLVTRSIDAVLAEAALSSSAASAILRDWLLRGVEDAKALPPARFEPAAREMAYDPVALARIFGTGLAPVLRRLAALPPDAGHPLMGLAVCDAAGGFIHMKAAAGFALLHGGAACPLWPLYQVMSQPGRPLRTEVRLPGERAARFLCYAVAEPRGMTGLDERPVLEATMLVLPDAPNSGAPVVAGGPGCRICPRAGCAARREPSILIEGQGAL